MKSIRFVVFLLALGLIENTLVAQTTPRSLSSLVNPFIGTGGHGHTFPGPTMPFGACQLSPDTRLEGWDGCSGYHYSDSVIYGFSHTHLSGTGCSDYGDILLMPVTKPMRLDQYQYASRFSHEQEQAHAGYYQVLLLDAGVKAELTATLHGGIHQYSFPEDAEQYMVLDLKHRDEVLDSKMEQVDDYTLRGYRFSKAWARNQKVFYEIKFSQPIADIQYEARKGGSPTSSVQLEKSFQCIIHFQKEENPLGDAEPLLCKVAISGVDEEGAHKNLLAEMPHDDFSTYRKACEAQWDRELSKINYPLAQKADVNSVNQSFVFYTALYHSMIHPSLYSDVDGRYRGRDDQIHSTGCTFDYYTVFSLWDTYRSLHPLLSILDPKRTNDFIRTFIRQFEEGGRLPIWELSSNETNCMIGYHVVSVIWDAYNKGIRDFDAEKAYEAMTRIATHFSHYEGSGLQLKLKEEFRAGAADADALESYCKFGYVRADDSHESVSKTLEYAYDDWCIAQMARALGKEADYQYYLNRSHNWINMYDPGTGFMRARKNGCLYEPFSPYTVDNNFTEANSWQYSFYVPHDVTGYIDLLKSKEAFEAKLDQLFTAKQQTEGREQADITGLIGQYAHGNEPSHHTAFLYNYIGKRDKMQQILHLICDSFYTNTPGGLIGNEDCGQMSAWYVCVKSGIYPTCPGENNYDVLDTMAAASMWPGLHGQLSRAKLYHSGYDQGFQADRLLWISTAQNGTSSIQFPHREEKLKTFATVPFIHNAPRIFKDSVKITMASPKVGLPVYYSLDQKNIRNYTEPFYLKENATIYFYSLRNTETFQWQCATFTKLPSDRKVYLGNVYNPSYHAGGAEGLMDGIYGKLNWRAGDWQGYQGQDIEVVMAFQNARDIRSLGANFLEDQNSWIFYPAEVSFFTSMDSLNWEPVERILTQKSDHNLEVSISDFRSSVLKNAPRRARYVKLKARNFGPMPAWHEGRGNPTFLFMDELEVE